MNHRRVVGPASAAAHPSHGTAPRSAPSARAPTPAFAAAGRYPHHRPNASSSLMTATPRPHTSHRRYGAAAATAASASAAATPYARAATTVMGSGGQHRHHEHHLASTSSSSSSCSSRNSKVATFDAVIQGVLNRLQQQNACATYQQNVLHIRDEAIDAIQEHFQLMTVHIRECTMPPSSSTGQQNVATDPNASNGVRGPRHHHHHFPNSRLRPDEIDRVLAMKVAELKQELSDLLHITVKEVGSSVGLKKAVLQHRLLGELESRHKVIEEAKVKEAPHVSEAHPEVGVQPSSARKVGVLEDDLDFHDDNRERVDIMQVVPEAKDLAVATTTRTTTTTSTTQEEEEEYAPDAAAENKSRIMSPPKVSEMADDIVIASSSRGGSGRDSTRNDNDNAVDVEDDDDDDDDDDEEQADDMGGEVENWDEWKPAGNGGNSNGTRVVDTTMVSIPFDEVTVAPPAAVTAATTTATDMVIDDDDDDEKENFGLKGGDVITNNVDSGRKRSRSPASSLPKTMTMVQPTSTSASSQWDMECSVSSGSGSGSSGVVRDVQSTLKELSVQEQSSPYRKLAKLGEGNGKTGSSNGTSKSPTGALATATVTTTLIGNGLGTIKWSASRNAAVLGANNSSTAPTTTSTSAARDVKIYTTPQTEYSAATLTKYFVDDKAISETTTAENAKAGPPTQPPYQPTQYSSASGGAPVLAADKSKKITLNDRVRNKALCSSLTAPTGSQFLRPSPIVEVNSSRSAAYKYTAEEEKRKAMHSKVRQMALGNRDGTSAAAMSGNSHRFLPPMGKSQPSATATSKTVAPPVARPTPALPTYSSPTFMKKLMPTSAKKAPTSSAKKKFSPHPPSPSPNESYEFTDSEDELSDDDEYDGGDPRKPKKVYPAWTQPHNLAKALAAQAELDPDEIFGDFSTQTCDLEAIFGPSNKERYKRRGSSGNWSRDRLTEREKREYKENQRQRHLVRHL